MKQGWGTYLFAMFVFECGHENKLCNIRNSCVSIHQINIKTRSRKKCLVGKSLQIRMLLPKILYYLYFNIEVNRE